MPFKVLSLSGNHRVAVDFIHGFARAGHEAYQIFYPDLSFDEIRLHLESFKPDFCVTSLGGIFDPEWAHSQALEAYLTEQKIPVISLYFDHPARCGSRALLKRWKEGPYPLYFMSLNVAEAFSQFWKARGVMAETCLTPVNEELFEFVPSLEARATLSFPYSFSGSSFLGALSFEKISIDGLFSKPLATLEDVRSSHTEAAQRLVHASLQKRGLNSEDPLARHFMDHEISEFLWAKMSNPQMHDRLFEELQTRLALNTGSMSEELQYQVGLLSDARSYADLTSALLEWIPRGLRVFGGEWAQIFGLDYPTPWLQFEHFCALLACSKIAFSKTKWQLSDAVNERPLIALAVGGCPLTDRREGLWRSFEPEDLLTYETHEEAWDLAKYFSEHEAERRRIQERGQKVLAQKHTFTQLAAKTCELVAQAFR